MSLRQDLDKRLQSLADINKILGSMRSLAYLEARKLARFLSSQLRVVEHIERAAADFLTAYPELRSSSEETVAVLVVIGSERGFCGDFNELLVRFLEKRRHAPRTAAPRVITVGRKLTTAMEGDPRIEEGLEGPSVAEEIHGILLKLTSRVNQLGSEYGPIGLSVVFYDSEQSVVREVSVLPPFVAEATIESPGYPPRLNVPPPQFFADLVDQYLFAVLYRMFYTSLMAEQQFRIHHLEGAMKRLEEQSGELALRRNSLRQEEITEEIEVILLGTGDQKPP